MFVPVIVALLLGVSNCLEWDRNSDCPNSCTCQLQHLTETAVYRFMQSDNNMKQSSMEVTSAEYNDVLNDDNFASDLLEEKPIVRSAICMLQTETSATELFDKLPLAMESLTLIQGYETGTVKNISFAELSKFTGLVALELVGMKSNLVVEIDAPLPALKYLNMEDVKIKSSKSQLQNFVKEYEGAGVEFEYVRRQPNAHPLTFVRRDTDDEEVLPYDKYKQQDNEQKTPLFVGFKGLNLLRITGCELNNIHWVMFDGLTNLHCLILERNNLKFIPAFAFYGTPNLRTLSLAKNNLLDIQITDLAGLLELEYLDLSHNNFTQLSELSLPPFPKLKLASFANNPITTIFPNTFEVMNTTDSLIIGSDDVHLALMTDSFIGLNMLKALTLNNLHLEQLKRELFVGMPNLNELVLTGNITAIEYDTFLDVYRLQKLILARCMLRNLSMDSFIGLEHLEVLDLSHNQLDHLPAVIFDQLINIKEIYLNGNNFKQLPRSIFSKVHAKLLRLNENPWECSCDMSEWKPLFINRIKRKSIKKCDYSNDKGLACASSGDRFVYKYVYDNKIAPKCAKPRQYANWTVFQVMKRLLKCPEFKLKIRRPMHVSKNAASTERSNVTVNQQDENSEINALDYSTDGQKHIAEKIIRKNRLKNKLLKTMINNNNHTNDIVL